MSTVLIFALLSLAVSASFESLPSDSPLQANEEIEIIKGEWGMVEGITPEDRRRKVSSESLPEYKWGALLDYVTLPLSFDWRAQSPGCIHPIQNKYDCYGGWAMAAADVLSDRYCIQARTQVTLSPQYIISCQNEAEGCEEGSEAQAWTFLSMYGTPTSTCTPFIAETGSCPVRCASGASMTRYWSTSASTYVGIASMQAAILTGGPIETCFEAYQDFQKYTGGVYVYTWGASIGGVCVKLLGWGQQGQLQYWIGAAYYGTGWGMSGYFYIKMGQLGIENGAVAGNPYT